MAKPSGGKRTVMSPNELTTRFNLSGLQHMPDLNSDELSVAPVSTAINALMESRRRAPAELPRPYLGASIVGAECLRKVQFDWWCHPAHSSKAREIFARGHYFEKPSRQHFSDAGFEFAPTDSLGFGAVDGAAARPRRRGLPPRPDASRCCIYYCCSGGKGHQLQRLSRS